MKKIIIFSIISLLCSASTFAQKEPGKGTSPQEAEVIKKGAKSSGKENPSFQQARDFVNNKPRPQKDEKSSNDQNKGLKEYAQKAINQSDTAKNSPIDIEEYMAQKEEFERQKAVDEVNRKQNELNELYQKGLDKQKEVEEADLARKQYNPVGKSEDIIEMEMEKLDRRYYDLKSEYESIKLEYNELVKEYIPS